MQISNNIILINWYRSSHLYDYLSSWMDGGLVVRGLAISYLGCASYGEVWSDWVGGSFRVYFPNIFVYSQQTIQFTDPKQINTRAHHPVHHLYTPHPAHVVAHWINSLRNIQVLLESRSSLTFWFIKNIIIIHSPTIPRNNIHGQLRAELSLVAGGWWVSRSCGIGNTNSRPFVLLVSK